MFTTCICFHFVGNTFQFQLPRGNLLRPVTSITPPPSSLLLESATEPGDGTTLCAVTAPAAAGGDSLEARKNGDPPCPGKEPISTESRPAAARNSPRLSLSLMKKGRTTITTSPATTEPSKAKRKLLPAASADAGGFEMGMSTEDPLDSIQWFNSSPSLPLFEVPSDSQFETSDNSEAYSGATKPTTLDRSLNCDAGDAVEGGEHSQTDTQRTPPLSRAEPSRITDATSGPLTRSTPTNQTTTPATQPAIPTNGLTTHLTTTACTSSSVPSIRVVQSVANSPHLASSPHIASSPHPASSPHLARSPVSPMLYLPSAVSSDFISPSRSISAEGLLELRRQVNEQLGVECGRCELRYVRTTRTVMEERTISSEVVENGVVVPGSGRAYQVRVHARAWVSWQKLAIL